MQIGTIQAQLRGSLSLVTTSTARQNQIPIRAENFQKETKLTRDGVRDGVGSDGGADGNEALHALCAHELVVGLFGSDDGDRDRDADGGGTRDRVGEQVGVEGCSRLHAAPVAARAVAARGSGDAARHAAAARLLRRWPDGTARKGGLHRNKGSERLEKRDGREAKKNFDWIMIFFGFHFLLFEKPALSLKKKLFPSLSSLSLSKTPPRYCYPLGKRRMHSTPLSRARSSKKSQVQLRGAREKRPAV